MKPCPCMWCLTAAAYNRLNEEENRARRYPWDQSQWRLFKVRMIDRWGARTVLSVARVFDRRIIGVSSAGTFFR